MIVDPDFPDHWKTRVAVNELGGDEAAPVYILRLWAHCQNRKQWLFNNLPPEALKALCRFPGNANKLVASLVASGFVRFTAPGTVEAVGFDEYNAPLVKNWENGKRGGRPKKPKRELGAAWDNPNQDWGNPAETNRSEVDELKEKKNSSGSGGDPKLQAAVQDFLTAWNASQYTRKVPDQFSLGRIDLVIDRFTNPAWLEAWPKALAKLPLKAFADPVIGVAWFLDEDTVPGILNGKFDFAPRGQAPRTPAAPPRMVREKLSD